AGQDHLGWTRARMRRSARRVSHLPARHPPDPAATVLPCNERTALLHGVRLRRQSCRRTAGRPGSTSHPFAWLADNSIPRRVSNRTVTRGPRVVHRGDSYLDGARFCAPATRAHCRMKKLVIAGLLGWSAVASAAPFREYPIGDEIKTNAMTIIAVYLPPVTMDMPGHDHGDMEK